MNGLTKKALALSIAVVLAGCEGQVAGDLGPTTFGSATTSNTLAQADGLKGSLLASLQQRFRQEAPDMINFAFNQSSLDAEAQAALDRQADFIRANPGIRFRVYGHTDLVGSNGYNQRLGLRRAQAAVNYMISRGVRRGQVQAVASFGETRPLVQTQSRERLNRRTVTQIVGFDSRNSGYLFDGKVAHNIYTAYSSAGGGE